MTHNEWEKEFDKEYGTDNVRSWCIGIIASAMTHQQLEEPFASANHITEKLVKLVASETERAVREEREGVIGRIGAKLLTKKSPQIVLDAYFEVANEELED